MIIQNRIESKIRTALAPIHLEVNNESHMHNVPSGSESHFRLVIVSEKFEGKRLLDRHREVNRILSEELNGVIHALAMRTLTPAEWSESEGPFPASPPCLGGDKD
jgi:BolA protein